MDLSAIPLPLATVTAAGGVQTADRAFLREVDVGVEGLRTLPVWKLVAGLDETTWSEICRVSQDKAGCLVSSNKYVASKDAAACDCSVLTTSSDEAACTLFYGLMLGVVCEEQATPQELAKFFEHAALAPSALASTLDGRILACNTAYAAYCGGELLSKKTSSISDHVVGLPSLKRHADPDSSTGVARHRVQVHSQVHGLVESEVAVFPAALNASQ